MTFAQPSALKPLQWMGGIIPVRAWQLDEYRRRPLFIAAHDLGGMNPLNKVALGRTISIGIEESVPGVPNGRALVAYLKFAGTEFGQEVRLLYTEGALSDFSIRWDWRSEKLRDPTAEERQRHGDALRWVAESLALVEISSVLLPADPGVGVLRTDDVEAAVERVRSAGHRVPHVEQFLRGLTPRPARVVVSAPKNDKLPGALPRPHWGYASLADCILKNADEPHPTTFCAALAPKKRSDRSSLSGVNDALDSAFSTVQALEAWEQLSGPLRQQLGDALTALVNIGAADAEDDEDGKEQSASPLKDALATVHDALDTFDVAMRDVSPSIRSIALGFALLGEALGVAQQDGQHGNKTFALDTHAIALDMLRHKLQADR